MGFHILVGLFQFPPTEPPTQTDLSLKGIQIIYLKVPGRHGFRHSWIQELSRACQECVSTLPFCFPLCWLHPQVGSPCVVVSGNSRLSSSFYSKSQWKRASFSEWFQESCWDEVSLHCLESRTEARTSHCGPRGS